MSYPLLEKTRSTRASLLALTSLSVLAKDLLLRSHTRISPKALPAIYINPSGCKEPQVYLASASGQKTATSVAVQLLVVASNHTNIVAYLDPPSTRVARAWPWPKFPCTWSCATILHLLPDTWSFGRLWAQPPQLSFVAPCDSCATPPTSSSFVPDLS